MRWPERAVVCRAVSEWANDLAARRAEVVAVGYFGSLARGEDWGVGSDADVLVLVTSAEEPFERRSMEYDPRSLPVPADVLVYTIGEWARLPEDTAFHRRVQREVVWVYRRSTAGLSPRGAPGESAAGSSDAA